ncbi:radial spoke head 14 homolog isoform X1 [Homo sapiens]|uniref:radial spoke head 14 homolog isoform X1 n=2 Tax=Homo sapiens TaxID=9606 RepID=UPI0005D00700|nr:radial spoke head 14 homolog isoform X1 [Homo sapiens]XP_011528453.1 radial spoke head 14 homolog isoform X1 [Homo sapiens]XP_011528454.1 radial spoke head 14 homolog isoform X1 [Homo sapiens]XP_016884263.1 radial spoke head 14 homolog isoform X1 [Homo sapiens]XP_054181524.1 radial spoke head 14 homolog isoform X1 [Homo sapiens]XP_054181525.1 radial spoke head 14 homolog isoform X1 [Homo sapiens]XP_054181526.1 radial spoke head 14 homolog isoform X1 [Homo sapiens]XP_054181529.1 radial spo|eukprot:XP_011528452.1 radial spoke head 14 homolog isoform X1 [Homo sapiens]
MAHSQNSLELPININATQITTAYGHRALPKLKEELQSEDLQTRQKALMALCDLMHDPECIYKAMNIGCMENLKALLKDSNSMVRIKTTEVLHITASHSVGRYAFLEHDIVLALSFLLNDPSPVCRGNLYKAYMQLVQVPRGAQEIISKGLISSLVWKLQVEVEEEEFQEFILDTLVLCLQEDATEALGSNVVLVLKQKLLSANQNIRSKAARALLNVSISREGKKQVCHFDVIPILVHLLKDPVEHVKSNAAGALMFATVITEEMESHYVAQAGLELLGRIRGWMERSQLRPERQEMKRPGPGRTQRREVCGPGGTSHRPAPGAAALPHDHSAPECHQGPYHAGRGPRGPQGPADARAHFPCHGGGDLRKASSGRSLTAGSPDRHQCHRVQTLSPSFTSVSE